MLMTKEDIRIIEMPDQEKISAGALIETISDSRLFYDLGLLYNPVSLVNIALYWDYYSSLIEDRWERLGINCITGLPWGNEYYLNGSSITRNEAVKYALGEFKTNKKIEDYCNI